MKNKTVVIVLLLLVSSVLSAQSFSGWWTGGNLGIGFYTGDSSPEYFIMNIDLPEFSVMHKESGLIVSMSPFHYDGFGEEDEKLFSEKDFMSFLNLRFALDLMKDDYEWDMTPYVSLNWDPFHSLDYLRAEAGMNLTWYLPGTIGFDFPLRVKVATLNFGYGLRRGETYFTAGMGFDILAVALACL